MITGPYGFASKFADYGYDQDVLTEYFTTISNIHGIITDETDDALIFSYRVNNNVRPLLTFSSGTCTIAPTDEFILDVDTAIPETTADFDDTILAIYRYIHAIKNSDLY